MTYGVFFRRAADPVFGTGTLTILTTLLLATFAAPPAHAEPCTPQIILGEPHDSLEDAALGALEALLRAGNRYESGGYMIETNGKFQSTEPVTQRLRNAVNYCVVLPRGGELAGIYHTHVGSPGFSPRDLRNAERAGVPSFIGSIRDRTLAVYDPRLKTTRVIGTVRGGDDAAPTPSRSRESPLSAWTIAMKRLQTFAGHVLRRMRFGEADTAT